MNRETIIKKMRDIDLIDFRDEDEDEHVAELVNKVASIVAMAVAKEAESRKAAQLENADLKERLARSGIEQRRAVASEREECAKVCEEAVAEFGGIAEGKFVTDFGKHTHQSMAAGAMNCAVSIRARGEA